MLERQLLERMITERSLMQFAKETGVRIDDTTIERAFLRLAQDNKVTPDEFRKVLEREGIPYAKYREDIRRELVLQRLREREVEARVNVTDAEVDSFLASVDVARRRRARVPAVAHSRLGARSRRRPSGASNGAMRAADALQQVTVGQRLRAGGGVDVGCARCACRARASAGATRPGLPTAFADLVREMKKGDVSPCCAALPGSTS